MIIQFLCAIARAAFRSPKHTHALVAAPSAVDAELMRSASAVETKIDLLSHGETAKQVAA